jgi:hypothetical protein
MIPSDQYASLLTDALGVDTHVLPQMFRTLCLSGAAGCPIKAMVGRAAEHGLNAAWEDTTAARSALKQSLAGAAMSAVAGTTGARKSAAVKAWKLAHVVIIAFRCCLCTAASLCRQCDCGRNSFQIQDPQRSTLGWVAGIRTARQACLLDQAVAAVAICGQSAQLLLQASWHAQTHIDILTCVAGWP